MALGVEGKIGIIAPGMDGKMGATIKLQNTLPPSQICASPEEPSTYDITEYDKIMQIPSYELGE